MAVTGNEHGFFWDSNNGDRTYNSESFEIWLRKFFTSGVFQNELQVTENGRMSVNVSAGYANCNGKVKMFSAQSLTIEAASSTYPRIDTAVVERNDADRTFYLKVVKGAYNGQSPVATAPVRTGGVYQLVLAEIRVNAGATSISGWNITDKRPDSTVCGWVTGTVDEIDLQQILAQSEAQFGEWFDEMKGQLSTDAAGNLQLQIDAIEGETEALGSAVSLADSRAQNAATTAASKVAKRELAASTVGSMSDVVYFSASKTVEIQYHLYQTVTFTNLVNANYMVLGVVSCGVATGANIAKITYDVAAPRTFSVVLWGEVGGTANVSITVAAIHKNWLNQ